MQNRGTRQSVYHSAGCFKMNYYVYILRCSDGTLYTGISSDPGRRLMEHNSGRGAKYTRSRRPCSLIYEEIAINRSAALKREYAIKQLSREKKLALAESAGEQL